LKKGTSSAKGQKDTFYYSIYGHSCSQDAQLSEEKKKKSRYKELEYSPNRYSDRIKTAGGMLVQECSRTLRGNGWAQTMDQPIH
jgi:hypothetical protein